jgi:hypothetical protein
MRAKCVGRHSPTSRVLTDLTISDAINTDVVITDVVITDAVIIDSVLTNLVITEKALTITVITYIADIFYDNVINSPALTYWSSGARLYQ